MAVWARVVFVIANLNLVAGTWQNVALNKTAWVSKVYTDYNLPASNAIDGVTTANSYRYAAHTNLHERTSWWKVDLQKEVESAQVTIYFRTDNKIRRNGVQLYTSVTNSSDPKQGSLCHTVTGRPNGTNIPDILIATCPGPWRYLTVYTETDNNGEGAVLDFVEVQVWTCDSGYYGLNCGQRCDTRKCKVSSDCDVVQGQCVGGCAAGYQGTDCTQACSSGKYGPNCARDCMTRHCKPPSSTCNGNTGRCLDECDAGWTEVDCSGKCPSGTYGINCISTCGHCADNNTCHHVTGACPGRCQAGWQLDLCQIGCDNAKFGVNCETDCGHCNGTCDASDGRCLWGCAEGYTGSHCSVKLADTGGTESQRGSAITPVTAGIIGLAAGICFMLILVVGLYLGLVRQGRLQWISSSQKDAVKVKETQEPVDETTSDNYTSISEQTVGRNIYNNDYAALDVEAKANSEYDVIKNQANENL